MLGFKCLICGRELERFSPLPLRIINGKPLFVQTAGLPLSKEASTLDPLGWLRRRCQRWRQSTNPRHHHLTHQDPASSVFYLPSSISHCPTPGFHRSHECSSIPILLPHPSYPLTPSFSGHLSILVFHPPIPHTYPAPQLLYLPPLPSFPSFQSSSFPPHPPLPA